MTNSTTNKNSIDKLSTGISGLDEILTGGLPKRRSTLICGDAGCGKTLLGMQFLINGALLHNEPGVFITFEESEEDIIQNVVNLADLKSLIDDKKIHLERVCLQHLNSKTSGDFSLSGLLLRLDLAISAVGAKRIVIDAINILFARIDDSSIVRFELQKILTHLASKGLTTVITAEAPDGNRTRDGIEEFVADCIIHLTHRVEGRLSTRCLRVSKYRGTTHGTNEYPFLIDINGFNVLPITSANLTHHVGNERVSTGITSIDEMMGGQGVYRGSSVLITGTAGCGKTSIAGHFVDAACQRGEKCLYFAFEESPSQICRNLASINLNLQKWIDKGLLTFCAARPSLYGLEMHLTSSIHQVNQLKPQIVVMDPISSFGTMGNNNEIKAMLLRFIDYLKMQNITFMMTRLLHSELRMEEHRDDVSSLIDTWIMLQDVETNGERNRGLYLLKSRGMSHSKQVREFRITNDGVQLVDVYVGNAGVLMGSSRLTQEIKDRDELIAVQLEIQRLEAAILAKQQLLESQKSALAAEFAASQIVLTRELQEKRQNLERITHDKEIMKVYRGSGGDIS